MSYRGSAETIWPAWQVFRRGTRAGELRKLSFSIVGVSRDRGIGQRAPSDCGVEYSSIFGRQDVPGRDITTRSFILTTQGTDGTLPEKIPESPATTRCNASRQRGNIKEVHIATWRPCARHARNSQTRRAPQWCQYDCRLWKLGGGVVLGPAPAGG